MKPLKELDPNKQLDIILDVLGEAGEIRSVNLIAYVNQKQFETDLIYLEEILDQLQVDGYALSKEKYVVENYTGFPARVWKRTFKGRLFWNNGKGGYLYENGRKRIKWFKQVLNTLIPTIVGAFLGAIITISTKIFSPDQPAPFRPNIIILQKPNLKDQKEGGFLIDSVEKK